MTWLGLDIGGANLKAANGRGWAQSVPFALWRDPAGLADALSGLIGSVPRFERIAVTMTGELCDCFRTKVEGVRHILAAVAKAAGSTPIWVYFIDGRLVSVEGALERPELAAASNWHALARFACRFIPNGHRGLLIDIGSTTTDIVPLANGEVATSSRSDTERLLAGELVYSGVGRTPVCAVVRSLPFRGRECPIAAELFATTADAYKLLGELPEEPIATWTADGRSLTREFSSERLARMVCADRTQFDEKDAIAAARSIREAQLNRLRNVLEQLLKRQSRATETVVLSGAGEFLARAIASEMFVGTKIVLLSEELGPAVSGCAAAYALAVLAAELCVP